MTIAGKRMNNLRDAPTWRIETGPMPERRSGESARPAPLGRTVTALHQRDAASPRMSQQNQRRGADPLITK
jgi:hypothetical protein